MISGKAFVGGSGYMVNHLVSPDYYDKNHQIEGIWIGQACEAFGVETGSNVRSEDFESLRDGLNAITGEQCTERMNTTRKELVMDESTGQLVEREVSNRRSFYDFTFSAPKTFSVLSQVGGDERVKEWHDEAVLKTVAEMERWTGRQDHRSADGIETTGKFAAAWFKHDANRALEPHLHDHVVIFNMTPGGDGKNYAVESREFMDRCRYLTAVYRDELARQAIGAGAEIEFDRFAAPQIKGLSDLADHFSTRTKHIEAHIDRIEQLTGSALTQAEKKTITFASRGFDEEKFARLWQSNHEGRDWPEKDRLRNYTRLVQSCSDGGLTEITTAEVLAAQRASLSPEQQQRLDAVRDSINGERKQALSPALPEAVAHSIDHHFERKSVVKDFELWEGALQHACGRGVDPGELCEQFVRQQDGRSLIQLGREVSTVAHLERERDLLAWVQEGKGKFDPANPAFQANEKLNTEQRAVVLAVVSSRDRFTALVGDAGTGKTFSTSEIVRAHVEGGKDVFLCAPSNGARDVLRENGALLAHGGDGIAPDPATAKPFTQAESLQLLLKNRELQRGIGAGGLVVLDEAGLASVEDLHQFASLARERQWRVHLVGDPKQHTSVGAGDAFRLLLTRSGIQQARLTDIQRQRETALGGEYRAAAKLLASGQTGEAFAKLDAAGRILEHKGDARFNAMANKYLALLADGKTALCVNPTHRENDRLSEAIRERLKAAGTITDERELTALRSLNWTHAQKRAFASYQPGMVLYFATGRDKGQSFTVTGSVRGHVAAVGADGQARRFGREDMKTLDVMETRKLRVGIGDTIMLRAGLRTPGGEQVNGERVQVLGFDPQNRIRYRDGENRLQTEKTGVFAHGYASTSHKSQGSTKAVVLLGLDRDSVRTADKKLAYVAATRGVEDIHIFTENKADLSGIERRSGDRKAAVEMTGPAPNPRLERLNTALRPPSMSPREVAAAAEAMIEKQPAKEKEPGVSHESRPLPYRERIKRFTRLQRRTAKRTIPTPQQDRGLSMDR